jgi:hypothetical protein
VCLVFAASGFKKVDGNKVSSLHREWTRSLIIDYFRGNGCPYIFPLDLSKSYIIYYYNVFSGIVFIMF